MPIQWHPEGWAFSRLVRYARSRLHHPAKFRIVHALERLLRRKRVCFEGGAGRLTIDAGDYIGWALLTKGSFEPLSLALAVDLMRNGGVFLDVGAHHGLFTVAVGATTQCETVAIEPSPESFRILLKNIRLNAGLKVNLVNCCASPSETLLQLSVEREGRSAWTRVGTGDAVAGQPYVAGLPLDLILKRLNVVSVRLLKIDVEGYETEVFRGLNWDAACRPAFVLMECGREERTKLQFLLDRGYDVTTIEGKRIEGLREYPEGNLFFTDLSRPPAR